MNDGIMNIPTFLKSSNPPMGKRIVLPKVSNLMKELIRLNVTEGTNKFVEVLGYLKQLKSTIRCPWRAESKSKNYWICYNRWNAAKTIFR